MLDVAQIGANPANRRLLQVDLLDQIHDPIIAVDRGFRVQYCNSSALRLFGWTPEEVLGQPYGLAAGTDVTESQRADIHAAILSAGAWNGEIICTHRNGTRFVVQVSWSVLRGSAGLEIVGIHRDITAPKQMEQALLTERRETEAALKSSEERFRIAAASSGDWICEWNLETDIIERWGGVRHNGEAGRGGRTLTGRQFLAALHPDDRERVETAVRASLENGVPLAEEFRLVRPDGEIQCWSAQGGPLRNEQGKSCKWVGVCRNLTDHKKVERANAELAAIVECADAAIVSTDLDGKVLTWNRGAQRMYGYAAAEIIGRNLAELLPLERRNEDAIIRDKLRRDESIQHLATTRLTKAGALIHVLLTASPIRSRTAEIIGMAFVAWDLTQTKVLEQQLAQTQKLESIGRLAAGIAHEINTPIQYIGDNGKFLEDAFRDLLRFVDATTDPGSAAPDSSPPADVPGPDSINYLRGEIPNAIEQLLEGVDQVARIVRAMREFSHPGPIEKMPLDLNRAIESTIVVSKNEWKYVAELTTDFDRSLPPVPCIAGEFNQVMLNLIVNAAHAIADVKGTAGSRGSIQISTRRAGRFAEIRVADSGCGIPEANRSKVFDPFFTTKPVGKGTGQGLAVAHSVVVQRHGGAIQIESEVGRGTTFIIQLPLESSKA